MCIITLSLSLSLIATYSVGSLGLSTLVPYYLPVITTLMLLVRSYQLNQRNKRWESLDLYVIRMFRIIYFSGNMAPPGQHIVRRFAQTSSPWCSKSWCHDDVMLMSRCVPDVLVLQSPSSQQCFSSNAQISVISFKISCPPYQTSWYHSLGFHLITSFLVLLWFVCNIIS